MARGNDKQDIFLCDADRRRFLVELKLLKESRPFELYAYCLMSNHFHLLIQTDACTSSAIMQPLLTSYARHFNDRYDHVGHVFQGRYKALLCQRDGYLLHLVRYIHLNPVRAGMTARADDWPWSGHHEYVTGDRVLVDTAFPLSLFSGKPGEALSEYGRFVSVIGQPLPSVQEISSTASQETLFERRDRMMPLEAIGGQVEKETGLPIETLQGASRARSLTGPRRRFVELSLEAGFTLSQTAVYLQRSASLVSWLAAGKVPIGAFPRRSRASPS